MNETQCEWFDEDNNCALRSPPSDPIFLILVALLTLVFVTPIASLICHVLENYARKTPLGRGFDDDSTYENAMGNSAPSSPVEPFDHFAHILPPASSRRKAVPIETAVEVAQFSYNGIILLSVIRKRHDW